MVNNDWEAREVVGEREDFERPWPENMGTVGFSLPDDYEPTGQYEERRPWPENAGLPPMVVEEEYTADV